MCSPLPTLDAQTPFSLHGESPARCPSVRVQCDVHTPTRHTYISILFLFYCFFKREKKKKKQT